VELDAVTWLKESVELGRRTESDASIELEDNVELEEKSEVDAGMVPVAGAVLESNGELETGTKLEALRDVTPMPAPRIDDCAEAVLRTMFDSDTAGSM
jgi:hypothetical protein